jgi:hypothetical protein
VLNLTFKTKLARQRSRPCLTAEIVEEMAGAEPTAGLPLSEGRSSAPLSQRERFLLHVFIFLIGSWNLIIINLANSPSHLWFWPWVVAWAAALVLHLGVALLLAKRNPRRCTGPCPESKDQPPATASGPEEEGWALHLRREPGFGKEPVGTRLRAPHGW